MDTRKTSGKNRKNLTFLVQVFYDKPFRQGGSPTAEDSAAALSPHTSPLLHLPRTLPGGDGATSFFMEDNLVFYPHDDIFTFMMLYSLHSLCEIYVHVYMFPFIR